jgi:hypothetical protein
MDTSPENDVNPLHSSAKDANLPLSSDGGAKRKKRGFSGEIFQDSMFVLSKTGARTINTTKLLNLSRVLDMPS